MIRFEDQVKEWSSPPVDDIGYIPSKTLLAMNEEDFKTLMTNAEFNRYSGWRNWEGRWRDVLGLDSTEGKRVLDYGSGIGIEALQYARAGNTVEIADISMGNLEVAARTLAVNGYGCAGWKIKGRAPFIDMGHQVDVIHCAGVLHHIPKPEPVVKRMAELLRDGGQLRLMLYSDRAWEISTATEPPEVVEGHPKALHYARSWDGVGKFADWYDHDRLKDRFGEWFKLEVYEPLTVNGAYIGAVMRKR